MKLMQPSFAKGEISPLLHARVDLAMYHIGLARLKNMIVLPQGGITRRPGFVHMGPAMDSGASECPVRLVPFVYNTEDAMLLEFGVGRIRFWTTNGPVMKNGSPYEIDSPFDHPDIVKNFRYTQSGNVLFLTDRYRSPRLLTRKAIDDWELTRLDYVGGPWQPTKTEMMDTKVSVILLSPGDERLVADTPDFFTPGMVGSLFRLEYAIEKNEIRTESKAAPEWMETLPVEVGSQFYLETHNKWTGRIKIQKSLDGGENWLLVRDYTRRNPDEEGQLMFSGAETEKYVLYRVCAQHEGDIPIRFEFSATGFFREYIFRIMGLADDGSAIIDRVWGEGERRDLFPHYNVETKVWSLGAWNNQNGYPGACGFYQDRLILAGSRAQPQTIWMSRTGNYRHFGVSDPVRDDDAINITIDADDMDGIHSLLALEDILVFTRSGEFKINGSGEYGAIAPNAIVAHKQPAKIGSAPIQPLVVNNRIVLVQTHGTEAHSLSYSLSDDGYLGSNISLHANHLFEWKMEKNIPPDGKTIRDMAYQQTPDSILWFALEDGTAATCTYQPEHEVVAWARQETSGHFGRMASIPAGRHSELWAAVKRVGRWNIEKLSQRTLETTFVDAGSLPFESGFTTLRVVYESQSGAAFSAKKLISRLYLYGVRSESAWVAPASDTERRKRRKIKWEYAGELCENNLQLDSGFETHAAVQIWVEDASPLTVLGISPVVTQGN